MSTEIVVARMNPPYSGLYARELEDACIEFGIESELAKSHFLGQVAHESLNFTRPRESLNYSVEALASKFGRHRISLSDATRYGRSSYHPANQPAIANAIYGGEWGRLNLGNVLPGDGWRFRGGGLIHTTGRGNFLRTSLALFNDRTLIEHPELIVEPRIAARAAAYYWQWKGLNTWAEKDDLLAVSRGVNLGDPEHHGTPNGMADRRTKTLLAKSLFRELRAYA